MSLNEALDGQCHYYLTRKRRYCRFQPKIGQQYCPEHACIVGIHGDRKRVPCPLNPSHNCYADELDKHVKKCNITKVQKVAQEASYYICGINKGTAGKQIANKKIHVKDLTSTELAVMIAKVNKLYEDYVQTVETAVFEHPCVREEYCRFGEDLSQALGEQTTLKKELLQQASLVGQLDDLGLLSGGHCFVEMGAGKGKLSHWIQKASKDSTNNSFLLIERSSVRYKMDSFHKQGGTESEFKRIKIDIEDLCLGCVELGTSSNSVVVVGKHLCGGATDMGIRCAVETLAIQKPLHYGSSAKSNNIDHLLPILDNPEQEILNRQINNLLPRKVPAQHLDTSGNVINTIKSPAASENINVTFAVGADVSACDSDCHGHNNSKEYILDQTETQNHASLCNGSVTVCNSDNQQDKLIEAQDKKINTNKDIQQDTKDAKRKDIDNAYLVHETEPPTKAQKLTDNECRQKLPKGIMIALCCHHYCTWDTYLGQDFMQSCGVTPQEFDLLTRLSSWATCAKVTAKSNKNRNSYENGSGQAEPECTKAVIEGHGKAEISVADKKTEDHETDDLVSLEASKHLREQLSIVEREAIGSKCKRLIDTGRLHYLRSRGMKCCLRRYISEDLTPENIVLIAHL